MQATMFAAVVLLALSASPVFMSPMPPPDLSLGPQQQSAWDTIRQLQASLQRLESAVDSLKSAYVLPHPHTENTYGNSAAQQLQQLAGGLRTFDAGDDGDNQFANLPTQQQSDDGNSRKLTTSQLDKRKIGFQPLRSLDSQPLAHTNTADSRFNVNINSVSIEDEVLNAVLNHLRSDLRSVKANFGISPETILQYLRTGSSSSKHTGAAETRQSPIQQDIR